MTAKRLRPAVAPPGVTFCPDRQVALPARWQASIRQSFALVDDKGTACMQFGALQGWVDDEGRITAVNLLLGSP